jgi:hypothetical protein
MQVLCPFSFFLLTSNFVCAFSGSANIPAGSGVGYRKHRSEGDEDRLKHIRPLAAELLERLSGAVAGELTIVGT